MQVKRFDLSGDNCIIQGSNFQMRIRFSSAGLNLTGATLRSQIRKRYSDPDPLASFAIEMGSDVIGSYGYLRLSPATSSAIPMEPASDFKKKSTWGTYDVELVLSSGEVYRIQEGLVEISPEATK
jgi:hypothetical protein